MALDKTFSVGEVLSAADANNYMRSIWTPIDKRVIPSASAVASVSFASLDSSFRIFRLNFHLTPVSGGVAIRINNDSSGNYYHQSTVGDGATTTSSRSSAATAVDVFSNLATIFEGIIGKPLTTTAGRITGNFSLGTTTTVLNGNLGVYWNNTSALINRIDVITIPAGTFHGVVSLEGMRGV